MEFDSEVYPRAYLITFRCYGSWMHGDARGSMDRHGHNLYGAPRLPPNSNLERSEAGLLNHPPMVLDAAQRSAVEAALREVCDYRGYRLDAVNVRTNHVHVVVGAACDPETILNSFKAYATRKLRDAGLIGRHIKPWARHGSTRYLWKEQQVARAVSYVLYDQGEEPPDFQ